MSTERVRTMVPSDDVILDYDSWADLRDRGERGMYDEVPLVEDDPRLPPATWFFLGSYDDPLLSLLFEKMDAIGTEWGLQFYRSDLYHDALWLNTHAHEIKASRPFWWAPRETGTNIGFDRSSVAHGSRVVWGIIVTRRSTGGWIATFVPEAP